MNDNLLSLDRLVPIEKLDVRVYIDCNGDITAPKIRALNSKMLQFESAIPEKFISCLDRIKLSFRIMSGWNEYDLCEFSLSTHVENGLTYEIKKNKDQFKREFLLARC